jgi:DNA-binding FadR family transcriptional regulator
MAATRESPSPRLAELVAGQLEYEIIRRGWPVGEVLGSERELIEKMGVSRAVFREAVRIVEHHDVARMRRGPGGGLVVTKPDPDAVQRAVALYLRYAGVRHDQLFATRMTLELACAAQAADKIDEEGIARLREVLRLEEELQDEAIATGHTHALHEVIAELTGDPVMTLFVRILTQLTMQQQLPHSDSDVDAAVASYHRAHEAIVDAIVAGDSALAQHRMRRHLEAVAAAVGDELVGDPEMVPARIGPRGARNPQRSGSSARRPAQRNSKGPAKPKRAALTARPKPKAVTSG